ncbi:hypothetical protein Avbf_06493, partial [Armadillidium vulgare]
AHGKGPCDGLGGAVKRLAARASLQRPYEYQTLTLNSFESLCNRFRQALIILGTQQFHAFLPVNSNTSKIHVKLFSEATEYCTEIVTLSTQKFHIDILCKVNPTTPIGRLCAFKRYCFFKLPPMKTGIKKASSKTVLNSIKGTN